MLTLVSGAAGAEWVQVGATRHGDAVYIDPATLHREGDRVKVWSLSDLIDSTDSSGKPLGISGSISIQLECDCKEAQYRLLASSGYVGKMGGGERVDIPLDPSPWRPRESDPEFKALWKVACDQK